MRLFPEGWASSPFPSYWYASVPMSQYPGGQPGYQYPMATGYPGQPQPGQFTGQPQPGQFNQMGMPGQQFQQQPQQPQQQQQQFGGQFGGGMAPQPTGFAQMRPQQTGFMQPAMTGYGGIGGPPPPPPVPQIPQQFQQQATQFRAPPPPPPQQSQFLGGGAPSFLQTQPTGFGQNRLAPQVTGMPPMAPLVPQPTGFIDPRLTLMANTLIPSGPPIPSGLSLQQSFNQTAQSRGKPQMSWTITRAEKKNYDQIFRAWDPQSSGFISGTTALEVFGQSGLGKDDLANIWFVNYLSISRFCSCLIVCSRRLADTDNRGKLNIAEFHVAMGLIYRSKLLLYTTGILRSCWLQSSMARRFQTSCLRR